MQDGFYKTGVLLQLYPYLDSKINNLQFLSNYSTTLIKKYLKFEEINQKLINPFRLALEVNISIQEMHEGYFLENSKIISMESLLKLFLSDFHGISESDYLDFWSELLKSINRIYWRITSIQDKVKIIEILLNFYMKSKSWRDNTPSSHKDNKMPSLRSSGIKISNQMEGIQQNDKKKEETFFKIEKLSKQVLHYIFQLIAQENFETALMDDYNNSVVYNIIVYVFNSLCPRVKPELGKIEDYAHDKEIIKNERHAFTFLYHFSKRFENSRINELLYNLISSKLSLKGSLNEIKQASQSLDEKKTQKVNLLKNIYEELFLLLLLGPCQIKNSNEPEYHRKSAISEDDQ